MAKVKITQSTIDSAFPGERRVKIYDSLVPGLVLFVEPSGKKTWYVDYTRPVLNRRTFHKIGTVHLFTIAEAREAARTFLGSVALGEDPVKKMAAVDTLGELIEGLYGPWVVENRKSGRLTLAMIKRAFGVFFARSVEELHPSLIEQWRTREIREKGVKAASLNRQVTALRAAVNWGVRRGHLKSNPFSDLEPLKEYDSRKKVRYLSDDERARLMKALDAREERLRTERKSYNKWRIARHREPLPEITGAFVDHIKPLIVLSLNTGARRKALFSLKWSDIVFETKTLVLRDESAKSAKTQHVPLNATALETLRKWRAQSANAEPEALAFPSPKTGEILDNVQSAWAKILKAAKIENFRWHDMRHDFASQLVMKGVDLNTVRELLGHADLKMTLRYAHLAPAVTARAVEMLG